ncbi:MAG TPA: hypothetical protein VLB04_04770 [Methanotrichaceae archaeon]|nr:hypothetical protein [Methanotrichaceae archaeon]
MKEKKVENVKPGEPVEPVKPGEAVEPTKASETVEPIKPGDPRVARRKGSLLDTCYPTSSGQKK